MRCYGGTGRSAACGRSPPKRGGPRRPASACLHGRARSSNGCGRPTERHGRFRSLLFDVGGRDGARSRGRAGTGAAQVADLLETAGRAGSHGPPAQRVRDPGVRTVALCVRSCPVACPIARAPEVDEPVHRLSCTAPCRASGFTRRSSGPTARTRSTIAGNLGPERTCAVIPWGKASAVPRRPEGLRHAGNPGKRGPLEFS